MKLTIKANTFIEQRQLGVDAAGVYYRKTAFLGGSQYFRHQQIDCVTLSDKGMLAFQVGNEVFSIPVRPYDARHQAVIEALVRGARFGHLGV